MANSGELIMLLVGDVLVSREDPSSAFRYVRNLLQEADIVFGNLEGSVADGGTPLAKASDADWKKADARQISALESAGFSAVNVANNHMMDFGQDAMLETLRHLDRIGVLHTGGGHNYAAAHTPAIVERKGCRVALLGYTSVFTQSWAAGAQSAGLAVMPAKTAYEPPSRFLEVPGTPPTIHTWMLPEAKSQLRADIAAAREKSDIVICTFHWGVSQGVQKIADYQIELGHHAIDAGADLVFGHHPHRIHGIEVYQGRAIFYSLGNFTFADHNPKKGHELETLVIRCRLHGGTIKSVEFLPVRCDEQLNPHLLDLDEGSAVVNLVKQRSAQFDTQFVAGRDAMIVSDCLGVVQPQVAHD